MFWISFACMSTMINYESHYIIFKITEGDFFDWADQFCFAFWTCQSFGVTSASVVASRTRLDTPQTRFCFRPCCAENGFKMAFSKRNKPFQTSQLTICWRVAFIILKQPFPFSESRGRLFSSRQFFCFGRPCLIVFYGQSNGRTRTRPTKGNPQREKAHFCGVKFPPLRGL